MLPPQRPDRQPRLTRAGTLIVISSIITAGPAGAFAATGRFTAAAVAAVITGVVALPGAVALVRLARHHQHRWGSEYERLWASLAAAADRENSLRRELAAALTDPLTGLPTRAVVERALATAAEHRAPVAVAVADADGLHQVNDGGGHAAGDRYLTAIADRLTTAATAVRADAVVARAGGDEFVVVAPHTDPAVLADAIRAAFTAPDADEPAPRASVGVAASDGGSPRYALAQADAAMYTAKRAGNQSLVYEPDRDGIPRADGTRAHVRRRDLKPRRDIVVTDRPVPPVRILCSGADAAAIVNALRTAYERWAAIAGPTPTGSGAADAADQTIDVAPTAEEVDRIRVVGQSEMARYATLADAIAAALDMPGGES
ncbi:GGDEF domain-containing protein [Verrucosispora sp. WMMD573]|uniref:GGDEF domain-containing protein n=1 Tax=Verrucosispora sp. WMMD573 TaxID=3015149 RepID=UPI00248B61EE|nr:GGDEF domain-containing protein [Verrucosispora sp. WMMD573]WBB52413.1 GGDEF domain-containing protein [Verrucosispora sp. WMMD573]